MIIESCRIENMGKLSNLIINFHEGLSVIKEDNGWGKSTLSVFIKAMFYGLDGDGKKNELTNERKRYSPWQGGTYGGSIVFSTHGKRYEVTRIFGSKASEDFFELRDADTNLVSNDYSEKIGEELFHINSDSFAKTVFIKQKDCASSDTTDDINSRIGRIDDAMDLNRYKFADAQLEKAINSLANKKSGKQGQLYSEINEVRKRCDSGKNIENNIAEIENRIETRNNELISVGNQINDINSEKETYLRRLAMVNDRHTYNELKREYAIKEAELNEKKAFFSGDIPSDVTVNEWKQLARDIQNKETELHLSELSEQEKNFLEDNNNLYRDELCSSADILSVIENIKKLAYLRKQSITYGISKDDEELLSFYRDMFGTESDPIADLQNLIEKNNYIRLKEDRKNVLNQEIEADSLLLSKDRKRNRLIFGFLLLSGLLTILLSFMLKNVYLTVTGGIVFALAILIFIVKPGMGKLSDSIERNKLEKDSIEEDINRISSDILAFMDLRGLVLEDADWELALQTLLSDAYMYKKLIEREEKSRLNDNSLECEALSRDISEYIDKFGKHSSEDSFMEDALEIKSNILKYGECRNKYENFERIDRELKDLKTNLSNSMSIYGYNQSEQIYETLENIEAHMSEYAESASLYADVYQRIKRFEISHNMEELLNLPDDELSSAEIFEEMLSSLSNKKEELLIANKDDYFNLENERQRYLEWTEDCDKLDEINSRLSEVIRKHGILVKTKEALQKARESMTSEYIVPLSEGFNKYYCMLTGESGDEYSLDADIVLTKYEKGTRRGKYSLSAGFQDLVGFCMRLSMADAMYKSEKPVLIMDDPFVNLDDKKMQAAKVLIDKVAEDYQIIYLTCREDRL